MAAALPGSLRGQRKSVKLQDVPPSGPQGTGQEAAAGRVSTNISGCVLSVCPRLWPGQRKDCQGSVPCSLHNAKSGQTVG